MKKIIKKTLILIIVWALIIGCGFLAFQSLFKYLGENRVLKQVIARLQADSRISEVLVTNVHFDENTGKEWTTIKFLEYGTDGSQMPPKYFTFSGNIIQFQSLVIRFDNSYIIRNDPLRGKSIYLFWKVFMLDGANTQEFEIAKADRIPEGYKIGNLSHPFEEKLWKKFWEYALNSTEAKKMGIKNAQIEAPGTMFVPGTLYTIKIEHDGGMRIDTRSLPAILRGERIP
ncbi:MAG: hypothetical protein AUJ74_07365 [Candidatus Omnitrophica bacterium CG1_02_44_16]|nr:MAG: hypothetical protein AUJ74_07365 [Candidatus Omnitrophica bacterium CG1_02_44_16]PIY82311.1 MAG: hypothetical protein COY78_07695 [Candidatus Omnitrophica bacterium CG_4_10_14_0_8_um_filter_44_12]PIZ84605.1 MAG: hypothetical protein COX96_03130 [Candidatus Omnitrophica bacterium CG_4_10_14_0_2_um_filter_44_9]